MVMNCNLNYITDFTNTSEYEEFRKHLSTGFKTLPEWREILLPFVKRILKGQEVPAVGPLSPSLEKKVAKLFLTCLSMKNQAVHAVCLDGSEKEGKFALIAPGKYYSFKEKNLLLQKESKMLYRGTVRISDGSKKEVLLITDNEAKGGSRIRHEFQLLRSLQKTEKVISLFDFFEIHCEGSSYDFLIEEYASLGDLSNFLKDPRSPEDLMQLVGSLIEAVHAIHEEDCIHVDIGGENIVVVQGEKLGCKLIDFERSFSEGDGDLLPRLAGRVESYPPEYAMARRELGEDLDENVYSDEEILQLKKGLLDPLIGGAYDVWSLGLVLYQMVYGENLIKEIFEDGQEVEIREISVDDDLEWTDMPRFESEGVSSIEISSGLESEELSVVSIGETDSGTTTESDATSDVTRDPSSASDEYEDVVLSTETEQPGRQMSLEEKIFEIANLEQEVIDAYLDTKQGPIVELLRKMLTVDPEERWTMEEVLVEWKKIDEPANAYGSIA